MISTKRMVRKHLNRKKIFGISHISHYAKKTIPKPITPITRRVIKARSARLTPETVKRIVDELLLGLEQAKNIGEADKDRVIRTLLMNGITSRHLALMYPEVLWELMRFDFDEVDLIRLGYKPEEIKKRTYVSTIRAEEDPGRREKIISEIEEKIVSFINEELKQNKGRVITALANIIRNEQDPNRRRVYIRAGVNALLENKFEPERIINEFLAAGVESKMLIEALVYYGVDKATIAKILIQTGWSSKDAGILFSGLKK